MVETQMSAIPHRNQGQFVSDKPDQSLEKVNSGGTKVLPVCNAESLLGIAMYRDGGDCPFNIANSADVGHSVETEYTSHV